MLMEKSGEVVVGVCANAQRSGLKSTAASRPDATSHLPKPRRRWIAAERRSGRGDLPWVLFTALWRIIRDARLYGLQIQWAKRQLSVQRPRHCWTRCAKLETGQRGLDSQSDQQQVGLSPGYYRAAGERIFGRTCLRSRTGFHFAEGWLNAGGGNRGDKSARASNPSRETVIKAMESLGGWDREIGIQVGLSHPGHKE